LLGIRPSHVQLESGLETDVWMNGWVLKKLSKDVFDGIADDVKDIKQELQHMYGCVPHVRKSTTQRDRILLGK
jgi:hypothetical protein